MIGTMLRPDDPSLGPTTVTVGCVNFPGAYRDKDAALALILARVTDAADQGCDLVIFPELALNSWGSCAECAASCAV